MKTSKLVVTALFSLVLAAPALVSADKGPPPKREQPKREQPKKDPSKDSAPKEPKTEDAKKAPPPPAGGW